MPPSRDSTIAPYLKLMVDHGASDLFFSVGARPKVKVEDKVRSIGQETMSTDLMDTLLEDVLDEEQRARFSTDLELNCGFSVAGVGRFRLYAFRQRGEPSIVVRYVRQIVPGIAELGLHAPQAEEARRYVVERGLTEETVALFKIGFALDSWDACRNHFNAQGYKDDELLRKVRTFTEKPNLELAETFLESGDFLWNSGIFIWSLKSIMKAFSENLPEVDELFSQGIEKYDTSEEERFINETYPVCKNISIDYGIMEKATNVYVRISDFGWSDLGTWGSLHDSRKKDENNNAVTGKNVMIYNTEDCIINMPPNKLVVINGLKDFIVVEEEGSLLICPKSDEQHIRQIVNDVRIEKGDTYV